MKEEKKDKQENERMRENGEMNFENEALRKTEGTADETGRTG